MRSFRAPDGSSWDVLIGHESFGTFVLLFSPRGPGEPRRQVLSAESAMAAEAELEGMSEEELGRRLAEAGRWEEG